MKNDKPLSAIIYRPWYIRRLRGGSTRYHRWSVEFDENDGPHSENVQVATVHGPEELAQAFRALPRFITAMSLTAFRIQMVLLNAGGVLEGHRTGLKEAHKMLLEALEEAGRVETTLLKKIV